MLWCLVVNVGDTVEVTDESNGQIRGEVVEFSGPEIHLRRDEQTIVLTEDSVREIQVRYGDSLKNGALIGGLVGAGFAAAWIAGGVSEGVEPGVLVAGSAIYVGAGLGIGIGIDALRKGWKLVYASPTAQNGIDISFYPLVTADRRGLVVRVCF
jgi:hypothetical protein